MKFRIFYYTFFYFILSISASNALTANPWNVKNEQNEISRNTNNSINEKKENERLSANPWHNHVEYLDSSSNQDNKINAFTKLFKSNANKKDRWANVRNSEQKVVWQPKIHKIKTSGGLSNTSYKKIKSNKTKNYKKKQKQNAQTSSDFTSFLHNLKNVGYNIPDAHSSTKISPSSTNSADYTKLYKDIGKKGLSTVKNTTSPITGSVNSILDNLEKQSGLNLHKLFN